MNKVGTVMITARNTTLLLALAFVLFGGCDLSKTTGDNQLKAGLFEARVSGDVNGSYQGEAIFDIVHDASGNVIFVMLLQPDAEADKSAVVKLSRNNGRPEIGFYPIPGPDEDRSLIDFVSRLWSAQKYFGSQGGFVEIRSSSETQVQGRFRVGGLHSFRDENGDPQRLEIEVTGEFHAEKGETRTQYD